MSRIRGFTLLELMITVAVVGLLATLAYPSYHSSVMRSKRTLIKVRLMELVELETRYFIDNRTYGDLTDLGFSADTIGISHEDIVVAAGAGNYDLSVTAATAATFTLQVVAKNQMLSDSGCTTLTVNLAGTKTPAACW